MSRHPTPLRGGVGLYWLIVGLWLLLCATCRGVRWLFLLGRTHAGAEEPSETIDIVPRSRAAPSFDDYVRAEEPSAVDPWLAGDADAPPPECVVERDPDGTIMLRAKERSRYRRKLIPPDSFTRRS